MNKAILAPAGGRKTQTIVEKCSDGDEFKKRLIITFTTTGQKVIRDRIWENKAIRGQIEILGWFSFLLQHFIHPYVYDKYPEQIVNGLHFVEGLDPTRYRKGRKRYFDDDGKVYSNHIGKLAFDIAISSNGSCVDRLERLYDEIYIDEVQDLVGNDLEILQLLFQSKIDLTTVGDVRQSVLTTSRNDTKYKNYRGLQKIFWFRKMQSLGLCDIDERKTTWRCNQEIIDFADSVLPKELEFPPTVSLNKEETGHDGIFIVTWENLPIYLEKYKPECYRNQINSKILNGTEAINFGQSKGRTVPRALIYPTGPFMKFMVDSKNTLAKQSASSFYVAITRAVYSVAIVVDKPEKYDIKEWLPE